MSNPTEGGSRETQLGLPSANERPDASRTAWRERQIRRAGWTGAVSRAVVAGYGVAIAPVLIHAMGAQEFGIYATITSLTLILAFADFGVGQGLVTKIATATGSEQSERRQILVSSGFAVLCAATTVVVPIALLSTWSTDWGYLLGVPERSSEVTTTTTLFVLFLLLAIPAALGVRVLQGLQLGVQVNAWLTTVSLASSTGAVALAATGAPLRFVVLSAVVPNLLLGVAFTVFVLRRHALMPSVKLVRRDTCVELVRSGSMYFVLNVAASVTYQTGTLIVAAGVGAAAAATFAVTTRAFNVLVQVLLAYNQQLWPAFAEGLSHGNNVWVRQQLKRSLKRTLVLGGLLTTAGSLALLAMAKPLFGDEVAPSLSLALVVAAWTLYQCLVFPIAMLLNALEAVKFQAITAVLMMAVTLPTALILVRQLGMEGTVVASLTMHAATVLIPSLVYLRRRALL